ncbi:S-adenosyl-L-methionine-dependent methyltransferase [Irpex rosettiformis]|uniref:S-adenosyl-L-methionine-dependent methyltransferase n=1 Tax=Irpex rosettiformis TaxID=378272 RepID=A0ACB8TST9_9APHY|nr:S-adenosyl-L-methionine-dependent methyltransferase [Irpex rosettiformis]
MSSLTDLFLRLGYTLLDKGVIPDFILRPAIRQLCRQRIKDIDNGDFEANHAAKMQWIEQVKARAKIADVPHKANEQHYEVSTKFMLSCLGKYAKYSCCLYPTKTETLDEAEILMMESYCVKAQLRDGLDILDLGCGWGSLSLYLAQKYPKSRITALSNSSTQKTHIDSTAKSKGLTNLTVITGDVNVFEFDASTKFDRAISIEMFEHMKNYKLLMSKIALWLRPKGDSKTSEDSLCFIHLFCHRTQPYHFTEGGGWMSDMFFSGGTMPSHDLLLYFQDDLTLLSSWYLSGTHYSLTARDWLSRQDANAAQGISELEAGAEKQGLGREHGRVMWNRFRVFYLTVEEFFGLNGGQEWGVGHYLFKLKA